MATSPIARTSIFDIRRSIVDILPLFDPPCVLLGQTVGPSGLRNRGPPEADYGGVGWDRIPASRPPDLPVLRLLKRRYGPKAANVGNKIRHILKEFDRPGDFTTNLPAINPLGWQAGVTKVTKLRPRSEGPVVLSRRRARIPQVGWHQPPEELALDAEPRRGDTKGPVTTAGFRVQYHLVRGLSTPG